jgi:hypothetical protein
VLGYDLGISLLRCARLRLWNQSVTMCKVTTLESVCYDVLGYDFGISLLRCARLRLTKSVCYDVQGYDFGISLLRCVRLQTLLNFL